MNGEGQDSEGGRRNEGKSERTGVKKKREKKERGGVWRGK